MKCSLCNNKATISFDTRYSFCDTCHKNILKAVEEATKKLTIENVQRTKVSCSFNKEEQA